MKISCDRQMLFDAVNTVSRAVSQKSSIPALEGVLLKTNKNTLTISGYDMELGITTNIPVRVEMEGQIVLSAKLFTDILRRLGGEKVDIFCDEKYMTKITSEEAKFDLIGISADEFQMPPAVSGAAVSLSHQLLKGMIRQTIFAVAVTDSKPVHMGIRFELSEGILRMIAVDGYRLALREEKIESAETMAFVVPAKALNEIIKLLKDEEEKLTVGVDGKHIVFEIDGYSIVSNLLAGEFLDYNEFKNIGACEKEMIKQYITTGELSSNSIFLKGNYQQGLLQRIKILEPKRVVAAIAHDKMILFIEIAKFTIKEYVQVIKREVIESIVVRQKGKTLVVSIKIKNEKKIVRLDLKQLDKSVPICKVIDVLESFVLKY